MPKLNPKIDNYLAEGCGRCPLGGTPQCKVHDWQNELKRLREIVLDCDLKEELKWSAPCYTHQKKNVLMISAFKESAVLSFFKGSLLKDKKRILAKPGENSQAARVIRFTAVEDINKLENDLKLYIAEAIELEQSGKKVQFKKNPEPVPEELEQMMDENPALQQAFYALTPGRQRGYILHFSQPKQSKTRFSRIEKCTPKILAGKGFHD